MKLERRTALLGAATAALALQACSTTPTAGPPVKPRHYVLVHGAWHGAWAWSKAIPLLRQAGHTVTAPTLSGLGERSHVAAGTSGLAVHVQDIVSHLMMEDLRDVVLVGHSYAGCVVSGVLAARTGRVAHAIYLDALVPMQGQSLASFVPPPVKAAYEKLAAQSATEAVRPESLWGTLWGLTDPALVAFARPRLTPQAALSFTETVQGDPMVEAVRRSYLKCTLNPNALFKTIATDIQKDSRFKYAEVEGHHNVMLIDPQRFVSSLLSLA
jgi:pimeloyl-ACP methyl ester carboxylesterase